MRKLTTHTTITSTRSAGRLYNCLSWLLPVSCLLSPIALRAPSPYAFTCNLATRAAHTTAQDASLDLLIKGVLTRYARMRGLEADFTQTYFGADGRAIRESGHLMLKRPRKARWEYQRPEQKLFISDGKNIYFYVAGERQATRTSLKESADPQIPFLFLLDQNTLSRERGRVELATNEKPVGPGNVMLRLSPRRAAEAFKQLIVEVSPATFEVRRLIILERNGARMDFALANVRENSVASDNQFQFSPPPGVSLKQAQ